MSGNFSDDNPETNAANDQDQSMDQDTSLDKAQRQAAQLPPGPVLIIAGPGSGKTRVLTHRIANLINRHGVPSRHILAMTFTNAAAAELKQRALAMTAGSQRDITVSTFHAFCNRLLRRLGSQAGHRTDFDIIDRADQVEFVKRTMEHLGFDPRKWSPADILGQISRYKTKLITPQELRQQANAEWDQATAGVIAPVFETYQRLLANANVLDFDDLLVNTVRMLEEHEPTRRRVGNRFRHILVDEFQDTDPAQYELCRLMTSQHQEPSICVVGDPDQSIYGWRNARIDNIFDFQHDYPKVAVVTLDANYRSTPEVVQASSDVIINNTKRFPHPLIPTRPRGHDVAYVQAKDDRQQAAMAVTILSSIIKGQNHDWNSAAILFRANWQSRAIEDACMKQGVKYRLMGATPFYQRSEIKHVLAYLRLLNNPADAVSFQRIVNVPPRRIGAKTIDAIMVHAIETAQTPLQVTLGTRRLWGNNLGLGTGVLKALAQFEALHQELTQFMGSASVHDLTKHVLMTTGLDDHIKAMDEGPDRWENVQELLTICEDYGQATADDGIRALLDNITLDDQTEKDKDQDQPTLTLSTLHKAKGTEFPHVVITGLYDGSIPNGNSDDIEEERRLFYVGITRAMDHLLLTQPMRANKRQTEPSRFIDEIQRLHEITPTQDDD